METFTEYFNGVAINSQQRGDSFNKVLELTRESILATKLHKTDKFGVKVLIDLDMGILDASEERYR